MSQLRHVVRDDRAKRVLSLNIGLLEWVHRRAMDSHLLCRLGGSWLGFGGWLGFGFGFGGWFGFRGGLLGWCFARDSLKCVGVKRRNMFNIMSELLRSSRLPSRRFPCGLLCCCLFGGRSLSLSLWRGSLLDCSCFGLVCRLFRYSSSGSSRLGSLGGGLIKCRGFGSDTLWLGG